MKLKAIVDQLATGSVKVIIVRGNLEAFPKAPYILVYDDYPQNTYYAADNTIKAFVVEAHFPVGNIDDLDEYIEHEVIGLLDRKILTDDAGISLQVFATSNVGPMVEPNDKRSLSAGNDDGTISKSRRFFTPRRGL